MQDVAWQIVDLWRNVSLCVNYDNGGSVVLGHLSADTDTILFVKPIWRPGPNFAISSRILLRRVGVTQGTRIMSKCDLRLCNSIQRFLLS